MDIKLTQKMIIDMCGTVSFKRGDAFYRANKVNFESFSPNLCVATVTVTEDFHVQITKKGDGRFQTECSCPALASFEKDCQHIAAVLLSIFEHQRKGTTPFSRQNDSSADQALSEGLLTLFKDQSVRPTGSQRHFENRQQLDVQFICKPVTIKETQHLFGIDIKIGSTIVQNIRFFLEQLKNGNPVPLSLSMTYNSNLYCFSTEADSIIKKLIEVISTEKVYADALPDSNNLPAGQQTLLIPASSWEELVPLLNKAPLVKLEYNGQTFDGLHISDEPLPLQFYFDEAASQGYQLKISGIDRMTVLELYESVLFKGKLFKLNIEDAKRMADLKKMLDASGTDQIPISLEQVNYFLDKVVPGLKKLGEVHLSEAITQQTAKTPLLAKLYLDRVNHRLLAGLEFHYDNVVIDPFEPRASRLSNMLIRDQQKEELILQLMEESSFAKTDGGYFLHNEELEYQFLYHMIPKLEKLVQLYATTAVRNRIFKGNARPQVRVKMKKERTDWLEFKFEMDGIPEAQIRDVLEALEEKRKYYRLRNGTLLSLETREFEEINRFLNALPVQNEDLERSLTVPFLKGMQLMDSVDDPNVFKLEESFRQFLDHLETPGRLEFLVPRQLDSILRDYQKQGFQWLKTLAHYGFGGILADDMGLGKTLQSITFIFSELPEVRKKGLPALIVCPSSLTYNWLSELMKFTPDIKAIVVDGEKKERARIQQDAGEIDVMIVSYPLLRRDILWYEKQSFHTVFFDEAQAFKNPVTQTARAVKKIRAKHRFALTGTPVENSLEELWSIFHVVFPELFNGLKEFSHLSRKKIARRVRPFLLRRLKEDVLAELPDKTESIEAADLLPDQKKLYAAYLAKLQHDTMKHLNKDTLRKNRIKILAGLTRLRQICCHPALFVDGYNGGSAKFEQLLRIVEEAKLSGRRVLIFSQFTKMLDLIGKELAIQGLPYFYLDGQTPSAERVAVCNRFNTGERDLFLISLKAGGTGLNLTGADTVILYDLWWNPAVEEQAADRAHRMGQKNVVQVIKLLARGTIEDKMNELQEKKRHLIEEVIDTSETTASALTEEDIREILMI